MTTGAAAAGRRLESERGSATIWVLACCALLVAVSAVVVVRSLAVLARHRAESGADLAAVAAAGRIGLDDRACAVATRIAAQNGGRLRSCTLQLDATGRTGTVTVAVAVRLRLPIVGSQSVTATARAARLTARPPDGPTGAPATSRASRTT